MGRFSLTSLNEWEQDYVETEALRSVEYALERLQQTRVVLAVVGDRATGKTALLDHLQRMDQEWDTVLIRQSTLPSEEHFGLQCLSQLQIDPFMVGVRLGGERWEELGDAVFEVVRRKPRPTVFLFDDYDIFVSRRNRFESWIRKSVQEMENAAFIVTVSTKSQKSMTGYGKPSYGMFKFINTSSLPTDPMERHLLQNFDGSAKLFRDITTCIAGEPLLYRSIGRVLALAQKVTSLREIDKIMVATAATLSPYYDYVEQDMQPSAQPLLFQMADPTPRWWTAGQLARVTHAAPNETHTYLNRLLREGMVIRSDRYYALRPLFDFGYWWRPRLKGVASEMSDPVTGYIDRMLQQPKT